jgi:glucose/arabinose dehydrogenase
MCAGEIMIDHRRTLPAVLVTTALLAVGALAQSLPGGSGPTSVTGTINQPTPVRFETSMLGKLSVPTGFKISVFARDLANARIMQVRPNGDIYLTRRAQGDVVLLRDKNRDGVADGRSIVAQNLKYVHGIAARAETLYLVTDRSVYTAAIRSDGTLGQPTAIATDLPDAGQHPSRTLAFGPDGWLYVSVGSTCNNCPETNPESATILRMRPDGSARNVYAKGLRNTIGFGWHPKTAALFGMDHGSDWRGDDQPPEELNQIEANADYGWPYCYGRQQPDRYASASPPGTTKEAFCPTTKAPKLTYTAHGAPIGMVFYTGQMFPAEYRNDAFVAMRGSWNRSKPSGYRVVRARFNANGQPTGFEDFASGWLIDPTSSTVAQGPASTTPERQQLERPAEFGRLSGLAVWNDGSLLLAEDESGVIYRITYGAN